MTKYWCFKSATGKMIASVISDKSTVYPDKFEVKIKEKFYSERFFSTWETGSAGIASEEDFKNPKGIIPFVFEEI